MSSSSKVPRGPGWRRFSRRSLYIVGGVLAVLIVLAQLLLCEWSPVAQRIYRRFVAKSTAQVPDLQVTLRRAGFSPSFGAASVSGLDVGLSEFSSINVEKVTVRFQTKALLTGRIRPRSIDIRDLNLRIDTTRPFPELPAASPVRNMPRPRIESLGDTGAVPDLTVGGALSFRALLSTNGTPSEIMVTNLVVVFGQSTNKNSSLPMAFRADGGLILDGANPVPIVCLGGIDPATGLDNINLNLDVSVVDMALSNLNTTVLQTASLFFKEGTMSLNFAARCRDGRLSGLASFRSNGMKVVDNPSNRGGKFLGLTASMWEKLASRDGGIIIADCDISGTLREPVVPLGAVLAEQVLSMGSGVVLKTMGGVPGLSKISDKIQKSSIEKDKYDDILKINRLREEERHYQRARHYERVTKNYANAVEEYRAQVTGYPKEDEMAVDSLFAIAGLQNTKLSRPDLAISALREVLDNYPQHVRADDALYEMILIVESQKSYPRANELCEEFLQRFPRSGFKKKILSVQENIKRFVW